MKWLSHKGGIGVSATESWESWWAEEQEHLQYTGLWGKLWEVALSLRFFLFQYGVVYQMNVTHGNKAGWVSRKSVCFSLFFEGNVVRSSFRCCLVSLLRKLSASSQAKRSIDMNIRDAHIPADAF